jgi:two-component system chemotaxis response regulator CheB
VIKILVVDDSALVRKLFVGVLESESDFEVQVARNGLEALDQLQNFKPDVIALDVHMPRMGGLECLDRIIVERPCPVLMVSALTAEGADATLEALRLGAVDFIAKPEGAVSLGMEEFAPKLVEKIRAAASAKIKASRRLRERVQYRIGGRRLSPELELDAARGADQRMPNATAIAAASGNGLVVVGTSTGGPPALEALLAPLPAGFPWPIVVAQHMPASFTGQLARRLDQMCTVRVVEVQRPILLEPGCVYIGRGDADIIIGRRAAGLVAMSAPAKRDYPWHPSTDRLVRSAMEHLPPEQLIGILMTGMGNDGAEAMAMLHAGGGKTLAEAEESAVVWGMPGELVKAGGADWVLPLNKIAEHLLQIVPEHAAHS